MSQDNNAIAPARREQRPLPMAAFGPRGIEVRQYDELVRFSQTVSESGLAPKGMEKPQAIFVAIQMGLELGLSPMASLQNVAVVNGRPTLWGDAQLAVCRGTGEMEVFEEWYEVAGVKSARNPVKYDDDTTAVCRVKRTGGQVIEQAFSVADAKRANLWGKAGPWTQYPFRMLRNRARSFALRDGFGDALRGFRSAEEAMDTPDERVVTGREVPAAEVPRLFSGAGDAPPAEPAKDSPRLNSSTGEPEAAPLKPSPTADGAQQAPETSTGRKPRAARLDGAPSGGARKDEAPAFSLSDEPSAKDQFFAKLNAAKMDEVTAMQVLSENGFTEAEFPADLREDEAARALKVWDKFCQAYQMKGGAK